MKTFKQYLEEKKYKDPLASHLMKIDRPDNRKTLGWVPASHSKAHNPHARTNIAQGVIEMAKQSNSGSWKVSPLQAYVIAKKYRFHMPNDKKPTKRLGSTGIVLWRKAPRIYYLVKFDSFLSSMLHTRKSKKSTSAVKKRGF